MIASFARAGLSVCSAGYGLGTWCRNAAFDAGWRRVERVGVPVVSVGNLTAGGTGKTPLCAWIADWYAARSVPVGLVSRGYRSGSNGVNDESLLLAELCPGTPHRQDPDRVRGAARAIVEDGCRLILLDDGFQHRRLARDVDLVLVDATRPFGHDHLLPRGLLREPVTALRRASLVLLTRANLVDDATRHRLRDELRMQSGDRPVVDVAFQPRELVNRRGDRGSLEQLSGTRVGTCCGIGNPDAFVRGLERLGAVLAFRRDFRDHHDYTDADLESLAAAARRDGASLVITTRKDLVKIDRVELGGVPLWAVDVGTEILDGAEELESVLAAVLSTQDSSATCQADDSTRP